ALQIENPLEEDSSTDAAVDILGDGNLIRHLPLMPGGNQITITYTDVYGRSIPKTYQVDRRSSEITRLRQYYRAQEAALEKEGQQDMDEQLMQTQILPFFRYVENFRNFLSELPQRVPSLRGTEIQVQTALFEGAQQETVAVLLANEPFLNSLPLSPV